MTSQYSTRLLQNEHWPMRFRSVTVHPLTRTKSFGAIAKLSLSIATTAHQYWSLTFILRIGGGVRREVTRGTAKFADLWDDLLSSLTQSHHQSKQPQ